MTSIRILHHDDNDRSGYNDADDNKDVNDAIDTNDANDTSVPLPLPHSLES